MALDFLREHGGCRLRRDFDLLPLPDAEPRDDDPLPVDLDFELPRDAWKAISVNGDLLRPDQMPRRFIDGSHWGHTVAWLRDPEGHPIPIRLAEIGGVCMRADGRLLRREFGQVERVVSMVADRFPEGEIARFRAALAPLGLRFLPAASPPLEDVGSEARFDFEVMREQARVRAQHEMEALEERAFGQDPDTPSLVDGRLGRFRQERVGSYNLVGVIKQQRADYLHWLGWHVLYDLQPAQRTPAFHLPSKHVPVVSWYLRFDGARGALPNYGIVRVEVPVAHFNRNRASFAYLNRLSWTLFQMRCRQPDYSRAAVSLEPIVRAEESLKSLFSPALALIQRFYRLTGL